MLKHQRHQKRIVIIGGGITGLSAAWKLQTQASDHLHITLIEESQQLGGKMATKRIHHKGDTFIIDSGPESFVTRKPEAWDLAGQLNLTDEILDPGGETKNMFVLDHSEIKKIPLSPQAFISSDLMTTKGKLRMLSEPFIPPKKDDDDESLADFVTRRLGREALDKMIGPVLGGIYNTDPNTQSILTTSPVMREMEKENGGLFKGALARMRSRKEKVSDEPRRPSFMTFKTGSGVMVDSLETKLSARILKGVQAISITRAGTGFQVGLSDQEAIQADAIILATPGNQGGKLLSQVAPEATRLIGQIAHKNIGTATLIFESESINIPYKINGLMIPRREKRKIDAITWTSNKPIHRAPAGYEMIRVFFGGGDPSLVRLPEEQILSIILQELKDILNINSTPLYSVIYCWPEGFPQAYVGHLTLVDKIEAQLPVGLWVAGSSYRGIGVPDCIRQGWQAADKAKHFMNQIAF